jgi:hypothetical protein
MSSMILKNKDRMAYNDGVSYELRLLVSETAFPYNIYKKHS